jgi:hypothetical protein
MSTGSLHREDGVPSADIGTPSPHGGLELGRYLGTDHLFMSDMLTPEERDIRALVSTFVDGPRSRAGLIAGLRAAAGGVAARPPSGQPLLGAG